MEIKVMKDFQKININKFKGKIIVLKIIIIR